MKMNLDTKASDTRSVGSASQFVLVQHEIIMPFLTKKENQLTGCSNELQLTVDIKAI